MTIESEKIEKLQSDFNKKYGVKFDVEEFGERFSFYDNSRTDFELNNLYRQAFIPLYEKAFGNFIDGRISEDFDVGVMINDFESVVAPFRDNCKKEAVPFPQIYGGWNVKEYLNTMYNSIKGIPDNRIEYAAKRYSEGQLSIGNIRSYVNKLKKEENPSNKELATLYSYAEGLSRVNKERPVSWTIGHVFDFFAERRVANDLKAYISKVTGGELIANAGNARFDEILASVNDTLISDGKRAIEAAVEAKKDGVENKVQFSVSDAANNDVNVRYSDKIIENQVPTKSSLNINN